MKRLVVVVAGLIGLGVLALALAKRLLPADWEVQSEITVRAAPVEVHRDVSDLRTWRAWSYWKKDDGYLWSYGDPYAGAGATASWSSADHGRVGLRILESSPETGVHYEAILLPPGEGPAPVVAPVGLPRIEGPGGGPMPVLATGTFTFQPVGEGTLVTWRTSGSLKGFKLRLLSSRFQAVLQEEIAHGLRGLRTRVEGRLLPQ